MANAHKRESVRVRKTLTRERLKELLDYDPATGVFVRKIRAGRFRAGEIAGTLVADGHGENAYEVIGVDYISYYSHQLAFLDQTGVIPERIDHKNGDGSDNSWSNLREATATQNLANARKRKKNRSGFKGVYWHKRDKKWMARIQVDHKQTYLGSFDDAEDAHAAYAKAAKERFGEFARTE